jgi:hypothetical protein
MTRNQRQVLTDLRFAGAWLGLCFAAGFAVTFPIALRAAVRRYSEETP